MELQTPTTAEEEEEEEPTLSPFFEDFESTCSTPYVSAPSSPGRGPPLPGFFYSAPASPMHFSITAPPTYSSSSYHNTTASSSSDFEFSARFAPNGSGGSGSMSSADELFLNGQIRPMKLSTHLERPQVLAPLLDLDEEEEEDDDENGVVVEEAEVVVRGRDLRLRNKSVRRRTRSMSPLRNNTHLEWTEKEEDHHHHGDNNTSMETQMNNNSNGSSLESENQRDKVVDDGLGLEETNPCVSASSSRSSSAGRSSKRWVFLKDFLRSKSEGRSNNKFWSTISFSPTKEKNKANPPNTPPVLKEENLGRRKGTSSSSSHGFGKKMTGKPTNGVGKRPSLHELHYKANRAQAEELRKKTFLPYRQGLLGCLGFSSKGYGAMNGFARALNPVSSRFCVPSFM